jgi:hypothetical protein
MKMLNFILGLLVGALVLAVVRPACAGTVRSTSGASATVADSAVSSFQCLVNQLDLQRYPVKFMRGCGTGSVHGSLHPRCLALDINQVSRGVTVPPMPANEITMATACGLVAGATWCNNDSGHFQIGGWSGCRHKAAHKHHRRAKAAKPEPSFFETLFDSFRKPQPKNRYRRT